MNSIPWKAFVATGLVCVGAVPSRAKERKIKPADLPPAVRTAVEERSRGAKVRGLVADVENGKTTYEVELTVDGRRRDVSFDADGRVLEVEEVVPLADVPAPARALIRKAADKGKVVRVESVARGGKVVAYEAVILKSGRRTEVRVDSRGRPPLGPPPGVPGAPPTGRRPRG